MLSGLTLNEPALHQLLNSVDGPVGQEVTRRGLAVRLASQRLLSQHGTGRVYRRRGITHQASAPGQPPAPDTGLLRASVTSDTHLDGDIPVCDVGSPLNYAIYQELGTRRIAPRPWLRPALDLGMRE